MARSGYHHGSLKDALLASAYEAARRAGPGAVQARALAKSLEVSPSAVYRHYPDIDHLSALVAQRAREELARRMAEAAVSQSVEDAGDRAGVLAKRRFRAIGRAYIDFAVSEPQLFDTAFGPTPVAPMRPDDPSAWQVLTNAVDELVATGAIDADNAEQAPLIAWSAVHGISSILVRGALPTAEDAEAAINTVLDGVMRALGSAPRA